jgi:HlyD family secretion protein
LKFDRAFELKKLNLAITPGRVIMGDEHKSKIEFVLNPNKRSIITVSAIGLILTGAAGYYAINATSNKNPDLAAQKEVSSQPTQPTNLVTALGRLEPRGEVISLSPPPDLGGAKIARLFFDEGDEVKANETIALLDNEPIKQAAVDVAKEEVRVAQSNLAIVQAGAKTGEIRAQQAQIQRWRAELNRTKEEQIATIDRLKAELTNAEIEYNRYRQLAQNGATSASELDERKTTLETAKKRVIEAQANYNKTEDTLTQQIREARANLNKIVEIRPVDIDKAQAELSKAIALLKQAEQDLQLTYIKAPFDGQIIKIKARPGEMVNQDDGFAELGQTDRMMVIAEVYESDVGKVRIGQKAAIVSETGSFSQQLQGTVSQVGLKIGKNDVLNTDPAADVDTRVVEVKILLNPEDSKVVSGLTYSKVTVKIQPNN